MRLFEKSLLLGVEIKRVAIGVDGLDALEESPIHGDVVAVSRALGRNHASGLADDLVGMRRIDSAENPADPAQKAAAALERLESVGKSRRFGIVGDLDDLDLVARHPFSQRRKIVVVLDPIERWDTEGRVPRCHERVRIAGPGAGAGGLVV